MASDVQGRWHDLPGDLLRAIYGLCSSRRCDRARFAAVCTSWRAVTSWHPKPPAIPLLVPSTSNGQRDRAMRAYSPEEGRVLCNPLPCFPRGWRIVGSHDDGWVAAVLGPQVVLVNLFTCVRVPLPRDFACRCPTTQETTSKIFIQKIVFSKSPSSQGCILAAITTRCGIAVHTLGCKDEDGWTTRGCGTDICPSLADIAFYNDELYGLVSFGMLYRFVLGRNSSGALVVTAFNTVTFDIPINGHGHGMVRYAYYIVELRGKLAIAAQVSHYKAHRFRVFELVNSATRWPHKYTWSEVTSLGDHALFLGPRSCKAVQVSRVGMHSIVEANRIYYSSRHGDAVDCLAILDLGSCAIYCWESDNVVDSERIMSRGYHYREKDENYDYGENDGGNGHNTCTWVLPPQI